MKVSPRVLEFARSAGLTIILAGSIAACAGNPGGSVDDTGSDLKGGVPANAHGKGKAIGDAAGGAAIVEDAGVSGGRGNGKGQDKVKKDKTTKTQGNSGAAAGGGKAADGPQAADDEAAGDDAADSADETP
jgi:hypothetical protein